MTRALALVLLVACKYPDPGVADAAIDAPIDADLVNGAYVVAHASLDGSETKVAVVRTLDVYAELDLSGARTFGAGTRVFMAGGKVFIATDRTIRRFVVEDYSLVEEPPLLNFTTTNLMDFEDAFAVFDPSFAWYFDADRREVYGLELETMTTRGPIYYASLDIADHFVVPTGAYQVNDIVYMPYYYVRNGDPLFIESEMYVAQFSYTQQSLMTPTSATSLRSNKCARARPFARLADNTLLFLGDSGSLYDLATPQITPNCLVRVQEAAPNEIDFDFYSNMDDLTSPEMSATNPAQLGDRVITWARDQSHYTTQAEWDTMSRWTPQSTDLNSLITEQLTDEVSTIGTPGSTFFIIGEPYLQVPKESGTGSRLMAQEGDEWEERTNVPGAFTWIERVR